jgi:hypothetical protein
MADPITLAAVGSAMATPAAAGLATGTMAGTMLGAGGAALGSTAALGAAGTAALANPLITAGVNGALTGNALLDSYVAPETVASLVPPSYTGNVGGMTDMSGALQSVPMPAVSNASSYTSALDPSLFQQYSAADFGPPAPTFTQSAMNTLGNVRGLMSENPALTNLTMNTAREMMRPEPPPQVLQAPPIQSGQFAPVNFASLLNKRQPMQRRTSLLG